MDQPVSVVIPVYNAFKEAIKCLESVKKYSPVGCRIIVIDDQSPEGDFAGQIPDEIRDDSRFEFLRNTENLGFVKTCNRGMNLCDTDVVLLNSDTVVTPDWLKGLREAAYSRADAATVTPLTNNGVICSVPEFCRDNGLPLGFSPDEMSGIIKRVSSKSYPELPTSVGFCMYIKRSVLNEIGFFDEKAFGKGYGEENDFSCRARKHGYIDLLDDATFVYHKGNMSFEGEEGSFSSRNMKVLLKRYPDYMLRVERFCRANPLKEIHDRIKKALLKIWLKDRLSLLHILHNGPFREIAHPLGGTELHVQDLINNIDAAHWSLVPEKGKAVLTAHLSGAPLSFSLSNSEEAYRKLLNLGLFNLIHLHHLRGFDYGGMTSALEASGNYIVSVHDYNFICPRVNLLTPKGVHCSGFECRTECRFDQDYINGYRAAAMRIFKGAEKTIVFSGSSLEYVSRILDLQIDTLCLPHGIVNADRRDNNGTPPPDFEEEPFKTVFLGFLPVHKGAHIISKITEVDTLPSGRKVEWHVIGKLYEKGGEKIINHGSYERDRLQELLKRVNPHIVAILSICPETYCLTLDEAWASGVPVLVSDLGAQAERVKESGAGWLVRDLSPESVIKTINEIAGDSTGYRERVKNISKTDIISTRKEADLLSLCYREFQEQKGGYIDDKLTLLFGIPETTLQSRSLAERGLAFALRGINTVLNRFALREGAKKVVLPLLPGRIVEKLKNLQ